MIYEPRHYRSWYRQKDLYHFRVVVQETDLDLAIPREKYTPELPGKIKSFLKNERAILEAYLQKHPAFLTTLRPWTIEKAAPESVSVMSEAAQLANVGPMAAVAGFFAEKVGAYLAQFSPEVLVENGGDLWLKTKQRRKISIYAGTSPFSGCIGLEIEPAETPLGVCTSSGTVGHSFSLGKADAVVILATKAVLADAVATAACNRVQASKDLAVAVKWALTIPGIRGAVAILGEEMAVQGEIKLIPLG